MLSRNLTLRILSGLPLAAFACWLIFWAPNAVFMLIIVVLALISNFEYGSALQKKTAHVKLPILYLTTSLHFLSCWLYWQGKLPLCLVIALTNLGLIVVFSFPGRPKGSQTLGWYLLSLIWISVPLTLFYTLRFTSHSNSGSWLIFFLIVVAAFNDICAYFGGKQFGRRPLAPTISPKKTIEGSVFGIAGGLVSGSVMVYFWIPALFPMWKVIPLIVLVTIASQAGDLCESKFKRYCEVKDSSNLIPGHGGLLDRIDAYLVALPVYMGLLYVFGFEIS